MLLTIKKSTLPKDLQLHAPKVMFIKLSACFERRLVLLFASRIIVVGTVLLVL